MIITTRIASQRVKIRMNSLTENLYLDRQSRRVPWKQAAWFSNGQAAEQFAKKHDSAVFVLFTSESRVGNR